MKLIRTLLITFLLLTVSSCKAEEEKPLFNEESIRLISQYNTPDFGEDYDFQVEEYNPNTGGYKYYSYYNFLTRPSSMFKLMDPVTFMNIMTAQEELSQFFVLIGDKRDIKVYHIMEEIQDVTSKNGIVTFFIDVNDIYNNEEVYNWYMNRFQYDANIANMLGFTSKEYTEGKTILCPVSICFWNQVLFDLDILGPNIWDTKPNVDFFYNPISEELKEMYPLGCEEIKIDREGWQ